MAEKERVTLTLVVEYDIVRPNDFSSVMRDIDELVERAREGGDPRKAQITGLPSEIEVI